MRVRRTIFSEVGTLAYWLMPMAVSLPRAKNLPSEINSLIFSHKTLDSSQKIAIIAALDAGIAQLVEHDLAKVGVEGSNPFSRSKFGTVTYGPRPADTGYTSRIGLKRAGLCSGFLHL